jgi:hypothetical protein
MRQTQLRVKRTEDPCCNAYSLKSNNNQILKELQSTGREATPEELFWVEANLTKWWDNKFNL